MLSDEEKQGLLEMARSATVREEFRALKRATAMSPESDVDIDAFVRFLTTMNRVLPPPTRPFVDYRLVRL